MALFYKVPEDLKTLDSLIAGMAQEVAIRGKGYGTPGFLEEHYIPEIQRGWAEARARLSATGRDADMKALRKHALKVAGFMDNGPYNHVFRPTILQICPF
jgi:hypothetical protein